MIWRGKLQRVIQLAASKNCRNYLDFHNPEHRVSSYNDCLFSARETAEELKKTLKEYLSQNPDAKLSDIIDLL